MSWVEDRFKPAVYGTNAATISGGAAIPSASSGQTSGSNLWGSWALPSAQTIANPTGAPPRIDNVKNSNSSSNLIAALRNIGSSFISKAGAQTETPQATPVYYPQTAQDAGMGNNNMMIIGLGLAAALGLAYAVTR